MGMAVLKFAATLAVVALSCVATLTLVDDPGLVLLAVLSAALGYLLACMFNRGMWMREQRRTKADIGKALDGIRLSGRAAPAGVADDVAAAGRYQRLDDSLAQYAAFLMGSEEER